MRRKFKIKFWEKIYKIWELTVWWYFLALSDIEQFLEEIFLEFNKEVPKLDEDQLKELLIKLFETKDEELKNILNTRKSNQKPLKDFHIKIWFFMKFFWNSYEQTMKTPLKVFNDLLEDIKIITWEEKYDINRNSQKIEKAKLKNLMNNLNKNV